MSKYLKYIMIASLGLLLTNCASQTYKIKKEGNKTVTKVPALATAPGPPPLPNIVVPNTGINRNPFVLHQVEYFQQL